MAEGLGLKIHSRARYGSKSSVLLLGLGFRVSVLLLGLGFRVSVLLLGA